MIAQRDPVDRRHNQGWAPALLYDLTSAIRRASPSVESVAGEPTRRQINRIAGVGTDEKENFRFVERSYGTFQRSLRLPCPMDPERVHASSENGVLTVTVPKTGQQERSRRIQVQGCSSGGQASLDGQGASGGTGGGGRRGGQGGAPGSTPGGAST